jgi:2-methylcitrate dehydratase PrpD
MNSAVEAFAKFVHATTWDDLGGEVQSEARRAMLNFVGCAIGGVEEPATVAALKGCAALSLPGGEVPILGRIERLDLQGAALVNCVSSAALTFDDTHLTTITHPTGPVAAAALAYAHGRDVTWRDFLLALALGIEVECRLSCALAGEHVKASRGWYVTGLTGGVGAAAAVSKLMGLPVDQLGWALGLGAMQAAGTRASHASLAIALVPGLAARNGLAAALLAQGGVSCGPGAIDGRHGLLEVIAPETDSSILTRGLGKAFELLNNSYKPYPCGIVIHPSIDACFELRAGGAIAADKIERIELDVHADTLTLCWRKLPRDEGEAQVSLFHWAAAVLSFGAAGVEQGRIAAINNADVRKLQEVMEARADPSLARDQARVRIFFRDGSMRESHVEHAIGSIARPMTQEQLEVKFTALCAGRLGAQSAARLLDICRAPMLDQEVSELFGLATPRNGVA